MSVSRQRPKQLTTGLLAICFVAAFMLVLAQSKMSQPRTAAQGPLLYTIKQPVSGLMTRMGRPPANETAYINAFVIDIKWANVEKTPGVYTWSSIDSDVQYATTNNMAVRLRFRAGRDAPQWLKDRVGYFYNCDPNAGNNGDPLQCGDVPKYWEQGFIDAYANIMARLAEKYDSNPVLREVTIGGCQTIWTETFFRKYATEQERLNWVNSGITADKDMNCHRKQIEAHKVWKQTRSTLSVNSFDHWDGSNFTNDTAFTLQMIDYCVQQLGKDHCVFGNNGIRKAQPDVVGYDCTKLASDKRNNDQVILAKLHCENQAVYFQTATYKQIIATCSDLQQTLQGALDVGAASVELPQGYNDSSATYTDPCTTQTRSIALDAAVLTSWDNRLAANAKAAVPVYGQDMKPNPTPIVPNPAPASPGTTAKPGTSVATPNGQAEVLGGDLNDDAKLDSGEIALAGAQADQQLENQNLNRKSQRALRQIFIVLVIGFGLVITGVTSYLVLHRMHSRTIRTHIPELGVGGSVFVDVPPGGAVIHPVAIAEPPVSDANFTQHNNN